MRRRHGRCLQRNLESWPSLVRRLFHRLNQNAAEGWRRRHQFRSFDDSGTVQHRLGQFVQRPGRRAVAGKLDHLGGGFVRRRKRARDSPLVLRVLCGERAGSARVMRGADGEWHIVRGSRTIAEQRWRAWPPRHGSRRDTRLGLKLQLQRRIARLPRTPARPIVTQSGRHLAPPGIRILRLLRFGLQRRATIPVSAVSEVCLRLLDSQVGILLRSSTFGADLDVAGLIFHHKPRRGWLATVCSRLAANFCSLASYASGSIRLAERSVARVCLEHRVRILVS